MSVELKGSVKEEALRPTTSNARIFSTTGYYLLWWSSLIAVQAFVVGQGLLPPIGKLNIYQALVVMIASSIIIASMFSINGDAGVKYGIPFTIHARAGFGLYGTKIVTFMRIIPAIVWYGVGSWIAALSANGIIETLTGFSSFYATFVYFIIFQIVQSYVAYKGLQIVGWFNSFCSIVLFIVMGWILVSLLSKGFQVKENWIHAGTWGTTFWLNLTALIGVMATMMLSISDMTRYIKQNQTTNWIGHIVGVILPKTFMVFLGIVSGATFGIWDPIKAMMALSPNVFVLIVFLVFVLLAQFSTNLTLNIMPIALVFMDSFKISWLKGIIASGILAVFSAPWFILSNMVVFTKFIAYYSAFFGPILGVMLADYWVIRKRTFNIEDLYIAGSSSQYWYSNGYNMAGLISVFIPGLISMIWFLPASWLIGTPLGFVFYLALFPVMIKSKYPQKELLNKLSKEQISA